MILQGELRDFSLPDVLQLLWQQKKSGALTVTQAGSEKRTAEIFISQGNIVGVSVQGRTPENKIQEILTASGRVSPQEMAELETFARDMGRPLLSTLTAKGLIQDAQRETWFQMAAEDMVCDLFAWNDGQYAFSTTQRSLPHALGTLRLSTEFACMEGMRRVDEWPHLHEALTSDQIVFQVTSTPPTEALGEWEAFTLEVVNGRRSLAEIGRLVPFGAFRLYECILNLWKSGCIEPTGSVSAQPAEALPIVQQSDRDQKTALVLGLAAVFLLFMLLLRGVGMWVELQGNIPLRRVETRVRADFARRNAEVFVLQDASARGAYPPDLDALVRAGMLSVPEADGPAGARLLYHRNGALDFVLE